MWNRKLHSGSSSSLWIEEKACYRIYWILKSFVIIHRTLGHQSLVLYSGYSLWHGGCSYVWAGESGSQRAGWRDYSIGRRHGYHSGVWRNLYPFSVRFSATFCVSGFKGLRQNRSSNNQWQCMSNVHIIKKYSRKSYWELVLLIKKPELHSEFSLLLMFGVTNFSKYGYKFI